MGRSASRRAGGGGERRPGGRSSDEYRRPAGENEDGAPTVRNIIPWKNMEKQLALKLAAKAARGELDARPGVGGGPAEGGPTQRQRDTNDTPPPDSGVRPSGNGPTELPVMEDDGAPLSFAVYTVADLDKHPARSPRMSMVAAEYTPPPSYLGDAYEAFVGIFTAAWGCVRAQKPRPRFRQAMRAPLASFKTALRVAIANLPWKKIAIGCGIGFGTLLVLLFIVLTAAELTDDLKPAQPGTTSISANAAPSPAAPPAPVASDLGEPSETIEIDDPVDTQPAAAPSPAKKPAVKPRPKAGAGKKKGELFNP